MRDLLERAVSFRLTAETHERYQTEAARHGLGLSTYLRLRLEADDTVTRQIDQLRLALLDTNDDGAANPAHSVVLELLLLSRRAAPPQALREVHQQMERLGAQPWHPAPASAPN